MRDRRRSRSSTRLFSLGLVAVVAGGVLLLYGLMQRKAIAQEVASGRYRRTSLFGLARLPRHLHRVRRTGASRVGHPPAQESVEEEPPFGGGPIVPTTPDQKPSVVYEPSISWIPIAIDRRPRGRSRDRVRRRRAPVARRERHPRSGQLAEDIAVVLDETLDDLRARDRPAPRDHRSVRATGARARCERHRAATGGDVGRVSRARSRRSRARLRCDRTADERSSRRLSSPTTAVDSTMKEEAIDALERVRDELRHADEIRRQPDRRSSAVESIVVRRDLLAALRLLVVPTLALVAVVLFAPGRAGLAARVYALVLAATAVALILLALRRAFPPERPLRDARRAAPARRRPPASLDRIEHEAVLGVAGSFDLHFHFVPRLRSIASGLLASRRRISLETRARRCPCRPRRRDMGARATRSRRPGGPAEPRHLAARARPAWSTALEAV